MATFSNKYRKSKKLYTSASKKKNTSINDKTTVEAKHLKMMNDYVQGVTKTLPQKKKALQNKQKNLHKLIKKPYASLEFAEHKLIGDLKNNIKELEKEIQALEKKETANFYLLDAATLLEEYHDMTQQCDKPQIDKPKEDTNILKFFGCKKTPAKKEGAEERLERLERLERVKRIETEKIRPKDRGKITSYFDIRDKHETTRGEILDDLMLLTDENYVSKRSDSNKEVDREKICLCDEFDERNIICNYTAGTNLCERCGTVLTHFFDSQFTSYKESQDHDVPVDFPYIRMNHFNELIAQFQAKEQTDIPQNVFEDLQAEFKKERISDFDRLNYKLVKKKLQKLSYTNMYEHIPYIIHKFNGLPPPVLTLEHEQKFRTMFKQIQKPFEKCKHLAKKNRKNFLSYSYVFYKFAELLELDDLLRCFRKLKSREKLFAQDKVWRAVCEIMEWEFIPSL